MWSPSRPERRKVQAVAASSIITVLLTTRTPASEWVSGRREDASSFWEQSPGSRRFSQERPVCNKTSYLVLVPGK